MKQDHFSEPPAMSRPFANGYHAIMQQAGEVNAEFTKNEKMNIRRALEIGRLLHRARPMANGDWEAKLAEVGISHQRASDFMWGAQQPLETQEKWESVADLRRARAENSGQAKGGTAQKGYVAPPESVNTAGVLEEAIEATVIVEAPPTPPEKVICTTCRKAGRKEPTPGCKACQLCNAPQEPWKLESPPAPPAKRRACPQEPIKALGDAVEKLGKKLKNKLAIIELHQLLHQFVDRFNDLSENYEDIGKSRA